MKTDLTILKLFTIACLFVAASKTVAASEQLTVVVEDHPITVWANEVPNAAATMVLLHGRTWSSIPNFDLQVENEDMSFMQILGRSGISSYAVDARGYGSTPRDVTGWLTPDRAAKDVIAVLRELRGRAGSGLHLFGWSYGSMVAQIVVQREPTLVDSVVLFGYPFNPDRHLPGADHVYPDKAPAKPNTAKNAASDFIVPGAITQRAIDAYVAAALKSDPVRVDFRNLHEWAELDAKKVATPFLLIHGASDPLALPGQHAKLMQEAPEEMKRWVILKDSAHAALLETSRYEMISAIADFVIGVKQ